MSLRQSTLVPPAGAKPRLRDTAWLLSYGLRGLFELVRARIIFANLQAADIVQRNQAAMSKCEPRSEIRSDATLLARIAYVIPRISHRLPWRSDCVIQAIAAQNWLASKNIDSEIRIGVELPEDGPFGAHAWLVHDEQVITGGEISRYDLLLSAATGNLAAGSYKQ
jgi:hypothetical protein